jgi:hypothetical protein
MSPLAADLAKDTAQIVFGWALGLGSAVAVDRWKKRRQSEAAKNGISLEFRELALRLVLVVYKLEARKGQVDRKLLEWMQPYIERYAGPNPTERILASVAGLLKASDAQLAQFAEHLKATTPRFFFPKEESSYATAIVSQVHDFDPDYAVRVLDILSHLRMFNEAREDRMYYHHLTFAGGLTPENHDRALANIDAADDLVSLQARAIVEKIGVLAQKYPI